MQKIAFSSSTSVTPQDARLSDNQEVPQKKELKAYVVPPHLFTPQDTTWPPRTDARRAGADGWPLDM
ncbi:hypothetical protein [Dictyobacter kobayashii]|uniref:Uncharacterized protein n=1 Tax=Dictyobacter kobayashii TaxID=2014872 RepID=A0A402AIU5_9CHLR|nr:hypothetical protein [Dictyobacter kobayashii]GCE19068.1 hypothetical protein KDK_28680 [Dictyobacter kobayashii]